MTGRPFAPPSIAPMPEVPEAGLVANSVYAVRFVRANWQRRGAIRTLVEEIKQETSALDQLLGSLGRSARSLGIDEPVLAAENAAISAAEKRRAGMSHDKLELEKKRGDENVRFRELEDGRATAVSDAEAAVAQAQDEVSRCEALRRSNRDQRKELERRQQAYLKAADDRERESSAAPLGPDRTRLRATAEEHRREAKALDPERKELDRKITGLDQQISEGQARVDAARANLEAARRSLHDAREGHGHRLAELDAENKRKAKEIHQAEAEVVSRMITLGTLLNLNRVDRPEFTELYQRIDRVRTAISARTSEAEKLSAERSAFDRGSLARGIAALVGGAVLLVLAAVLIIAAL